MMTKTLTQLIQNGEGLTTEFKRTIDSPFKIAKTLVSFANTSGGTLLVGVGDKGELLGVSSELRELEKLEKATEKLIEPLLLVSIKSVQLDGKKLLLVDVHESDDKPHYAINEKSDRVLYIRIKDKSVPIPKLLMPGAADADTEKLLTTRHVKTLITYLKETDSVTAKAFSRIINISEKRAERMLHDLAAKQILIKIGSTKSASFSLKWSEKRAPDYTQG